MSGIMVHTTLVAFGISVLIIAAPTLFRALKIAGAVYLLVARLAGDRPWRRAAARRGGEEAADAG